MRARCSAPHHPALVHEGDPPGLPAPAAPDSELRLDPAVVRLQPQARSPAAPACPVNPGFPAAAGRRRRWGEEQPDDERGSRRPQDPPGETERHRRTIARSQSTSRPPTERKAHAQAGIAQRRGPARARGGREPRPRARQDGGESPGDHSTSGERPPRVKPRAADFFGTLKPRVPYCPAGLALLTGECQAKYANRLKSTLNRRLRS